MARDARAGDRVVLVKCCKRGPVLVLASMRPRWQCYCGSLGTDDGVFVLGEPGDPNVRS